ncbi:MAG: DUF5615 family PIN-like protein [Fimbriimonadaceae bacterium]|nr:DUF5615 family PIN-like protein [Fimbriimonadaceae bacterium]
MKVLLDSCVNPRAREALEAAGHRVESVLEWASDPGDRLILAEAARHGQVLVTLDRGFGELVLRVGLPCCGLVHLADLPTERHGAVTATVLAQHSAHLASGGVVLCRKSRLRLRSRPHVER